MPLQITTLMENSLGEHTGLSIEHGLSFLVEHGNTSLLFDTGRSGAFLDNARRLLKDTAKVTDVVLSHGHYDHTGGFLSFVESRDNQDYTLWTGDGFFTPKYARFQGSYQYLGNDFTKEELISRGVSLQTVKSKKTEIRDGIWLVTDFARVHTQEVPHARFVLYNEQTQQFTPDDFSDEIALVIETKQGLVILLGCSHPGLLNMLDAIEESFNQPIFALLGGTHLVEADEKRTCSTLDTLAERGIALMGLSHCTGEEAIALSKKYSERHFRGCTGSTIILEG